MKEKSARESQLVTTEIKNLNVRNAVSKVNKSFFSMREKSVRESQLARKHARSLLFLHPLLLGVRSVLLFYHHQHHPHHHHQHLLHHSQRQFAIIVIFWQSIFMLCLSIIVITIIMNSSLAERGCSPVDGHHWKQRRRRPAVGNQGAASFSFPFNPDSKDSCDSIIFRPGSLYSCGERDPSTLSSPFQLPGDPWSNRTGIVDFPFQLHQ